MPITFSYGSKNHMLISHYHDGLQTRGPYAVLKIEPKAQLRGTFRICR